MQCKQQKGAMYSMSKNKYIQEEILEIISDKMFKDHYNPSEVLQTNTPYILSRMREVSAGMGLPMARY